VGGVKFVTAHWVLQDLPDFPIENQIALKMQPGSHVRATDAMSHKCITVSDFNDCHFGFPASSLATDTQSPCLCPLVLGVLCGRGPHTSTKLNLRHFPAELAGCTCS